MFLLNYFNFLRLFVRNVFSVNHNHFAQTCKLDVSFDIYIDFIKLPHYNNFLKMH